jgi:hypothetical protein
LSYRVGKNYPSEAKGFKLIYVKVRVCFEKHTWLLLVDHGLIIKKFKGSSAKNARCMRGLRVF